MTGQSTTPERRRGPAPPYADRRASPTRARHRGPTSTSAGPRATQHGRRITNIHRINVINNFGVEGEDRGPYARVHVGWCGLRLALAILLVFWFGTMASVLRGAPAPPEPAPRWAPTNAAPMTAAKTAAADATGRGASPAFSELSLFGGDATPAGAFLSRTPHAPSCARPLDAPAVAFTLVSQLSEDRLWMVPFHCERWGDRPVSLAVFSDRTPADVRRELVQKGCAAARLTVRTVGRARLDPAGTEYPVNLLRNLALAAVATSHVVYADVDFWPSQNLGPALSSLGVTAKFAADPRFAVVVPVFQMNRRCRAYKDCRGNNVPAMPATKAALFDLVKDRKASTFDPTNRGGHGSTKYITWRDQDTGTLVELPCIKSNRYEPYLAFRYCSDLPPFQERFTGYGKNKMTWVMQLRRTGYVFSQLGGVFLVHYPHLNSASRLEWDKKPKELQDTPLEVARTRKKIDWSSSKRAQVDALFVDFKEWLDGREDASRVPMCADALDDDARLWVHAAAGDGTDDAATDAAGDAGDSADAETDDGEYFEEYGDFLDAQEAYDGCREEETEAPGACGARAREFVRASVAWSAVGARSDYMGAETHMEYLVAAEECAARHSALARGGEGAEGDGDPEGTGAFRPLLVDLYASMGAVEQSRNATAKAASFARRALELDPNWEAARTILSELSENKVEEITPKKREQRVSKDTESTGEDVE